MSPSTTSSTRHAQPLTWLVGRVDLADDAAAFECLVAAVCFQRGRCSETQQRFEHAAELAADPRERCNSLQLAAGAALVRYAGTEAAALLRRAADVADAAGDSNAATLALARCATIQHRHIGTMVEIISTPETDALLHRARTRGRGAICAAAVAVAESSRTDVPGSPEVTERAVELAVASGDALLIDAALDQLCGRHLECGDLAAASTVTARRLEGLARVPVDARSAMDHTDAHLMAAHVELAAGRLRASRRHAVALAKLPFLREERHVALARTLEVDTLAGEFDEVIRSAALFESSWQHAGRPQVNYLGTAAYATAMVHGMLGAEDARKHWIGIVRALLRNPETLDDIVWVWPATFDAMLLLHRHEPDAAVARLGCPPGEIPEAARWHQALWLPWYAAMWAEACGLAGGPGAAVELDRVIQFTAGNILAQTIVERTRAVLFGDSSAAGDFVARFADAGCPYQEQRTRRLLGVFEPAKSDFRCPGGRSSRAPEHPRSSRFSASWRPAAPTPRSPRRSTSAARPRSTTYPASSRNSALPHAPKQLRSQDASASPVRDDHFRPDQQLNEWNTHSLGPMLRQT